MIKISFRKLLGSAVVFIASLSVVMLIGIKADAASNVSISKENFPDKTIRKIATSHDKNKDGYLSTAEIKKIKKVKIGQKAITSFKGIEKFSCLKTFIYKGNSTTKESVDLDLSKNKKLKSVEIAYTASGSDQSIRKINLQGCKKLEILRVVGQTKQINLTGCINLREIYLYSEGGLQTLDVSNCKRLEKLNVANGPKLKKIKFGKIKSLKDLEIRNCKKLNTLNIKKQIKLESLTMFNLPKLQSLNVSKNAKLQAISLVQVPISEIDLSAHKKLSHFHCVGTNLKKLDLSTTKITETMKDNDEYFRCYDEAVEVIFAKVGSVPNTARATKQNKPKQRVSISGVTYVFEPEDTNSEYAEGGNVGENAFANTLLVNESRSKGEPTIVNRGILLEAQGVEGDIKLTGEQVRIVLSMMQKRYSTHLEVVRN